MSILIKGMEMPKNCIFCELYEADLYWCRAAKKEYFETIENKAHPVWCPLVSVPPHGDLISREWLIDIALHLMNIAKNDDIANGVKWLWQYVIEAPSIIESEGEEADG